MSSDAVGQKFIDSELVIGLVGAVGTELDKVIGVIKDRLSAFTYNGEPVHLSAEVIPKIIKPKPFDPNNKCERTNVLMDAGNDAREYSKDNSILALGAAAKIGENRPSGKNHPAFKLRQAYIIKSLKRPEEVSTLREIYSEGFFLIGVYSDEERRLNHLTEDEKMSRDDAIMLMDRDAYERPPYGQRTSETFHLSDFFIYLDENHDKMKKSIWRFLDIIFGHPYITPTFDEYAMFMAFSAALRSADLSRQVGVVITKNNGIIATGANDCPKFGGGLYWPFYSKEKNEIIDEKNGRDHMRGEDSNETEKENIINDIWKQFEKNRVQIKEEELKAALRNSKIKDITEYGRVVHAEMEALLSCARNSISSQDATLYCTTFPCHNCAKHIIAAGIKRVVYVEPYSKSKAAEFHDDSICLGLEGEEDTLIHFEPFAGVGPRRFFDLFSMNLSSGYPLKRKDDKGKKVEWERDKSKLRIQMVPDSYIARETSVTSRFNIIREEIKNGNNN